MTPEEAKSAVQALQQWRMLAMKTRGDMTVEPQLASILRQLEDEEDF
jgi:hypothetical protein